MERLAPKQKSLDLSREFLTLGSPLIKTTIWTSHKDPEAAKKNLQRELKNIEIWVRKSRVKPNPTKSQHMLITHLLSINIRHLGAPSGCIRCKIYLARKNERSERAINSTPSLSNYYYQYVDHLTGDKSRQNNPDENLDSSVGPRSHNSHRNLITTGTELSGRRGQG
ncbi:hypothetical protein MTP99_016115 [Tenebrio molitor]|nr:hypothetical protein MTP99_016115 [Tenebrio molitor]